MPWIYDYDEKVTIDSVDHNKKFVFIGDSSGTAKNIYIAPRHWSDVDPTADTFTQDEFIKLCNNNWQSQMKVGALITLNNVYCDTYEVIGVNHDNTKNTVDIMSHTQVQTMEFGNSEYYSECTLRTWLNGTYLSAFDSSIQNLAKTMSVATNDSTVSNKVKALSCTELGGGSGCIEGTMYEAFNSGSSYRSAGSYGYRYYWTRSRGDKSTKVYYVDQYGSTIYSAYYFYTGGVVAALRF